MKIMNVTKDKRPMIPKGKITIKWIKSRNVFQAYAGGKYLGGCSGDTEDEARDMIKLNYELRGKGAPEGNRNAQKGDSPASSNILIRCRPDQKEDAKAKATAEGLTLSEWILQRCKL